MDVNLHFLFRTRIHETFSDILCNTHFIITATLYEAILS